MGRLERDKQDEQPFMVLDLLPKNRTGIQYSKISAGYQKRNFAQDETVSSFTTVTKCLDYLCEKGFAKKRPDGQYAITTYGLQELKERKKIKNRKKMPLFVTKDGMRLDMHPTRGYVSREIKRSQKHLVPIASVRFPLAFKSISAKELAASATILSHVNEDLPESIWNEEIPRESIRNLLMDLGRSSKKLLDSLLPDVYMRVSQGNTTRSFPEEYGWQEKASNFPIQIVIAFDGRKLHPVFRREMLKGQRAREADDRVLDAFRKELTDPVISVELTQSVFANVFQTKFWLNDEVLEEDFIHGAGEHWKDLKSSLNRPDGAQFLKTWEQGGFIRSFEEEFEDTESHETIKIKWFEPTDRFQELHPEKAEDVVSAIDHLGCFRPPWGEADPSMFDDDPSTPN